MFGHGPEFKVSTHVRSVHLYEAEVLLVQRRKERHFSSNTRRGLNFGRGLEFKVSTEVRSVHKY